MSAPRILCPVCQTGPLDPPKACEFCPDCVVEELDEIERALERLASLAAGVPRARAAERDHEPAAV